MNLPGGWELVLILAVIVLLFGAKRLPEASRSLGRSMRIFKAETKGLRDDDEPRRDRGYGDDGRDGGYRRDGGSARDEGHGRDAGYGRDARDLEGGYRSYRGQGADDPYREQDRYEGETRPGSYDPRPHDARQYDRMIHPQPLPEAQPLPGSPPVPGAPPAPGSVASPDTSR